MKWIHIIILVLTCGSTYAKRLAPETVDALSYRKGTISHSFEKKSDGVTVTIIAKDNAGDIRWKTQIYQVIYKNNLETDIQDVHLQKLYLEDNQVVAVDELGKKYRLNLADGEIEN